MVPFSKATSPCPGGTVTAMGEGAFAQEPGPTYPVNNVLFTGAHDGFLLITRGNRCHRHCAGQWQDATVTSMKYDYK